MNNKEALSLFARYFILVLFGLNGMYVISILAAPLTTYPVFLVLNTLYGAQLLIGSKIFFQGHYIELVKPCIGTLAIYLLLILNLTTPMNMVKRVKSLVFLLISFILLNVIRIIVFATMFAEGYKYFSLAHELTWYFGSTILLIIIWFSNVLILKIKEIPVFSDAAMLIRDIASKKSSEKPVSRKSIKHKRK